MRFVIVLGGILILTACNDLPGRPGPGPEVIRPDEVLDFKVLYKENCSGCHGADGKGNAAIALSNPVYLAIADNAVLESVIAGGHGAGMPAFAQGKGGSLTDKQIETIVAGIRAWARLDSQRDINVVPAYSASTPGDAKRGGDVYATFCSACHGGDGRGGKSSSIVDGSYLALVSDQYLRTVVIAGRPEIGAPDWRSNVQGRPMSEQEITDVVAWLAS